MASAVPHPLQSVPAFLSMLPESRFLVQAKSCKPGFRLVLLCITQRIIDHTKVTVLPPPKWVLNSNTKMLTGVVLYIVAIFSCISVFGTVVFLETPMTMCFLWSKSLVMNFLGRTIRPLVCLSSWWVLEQRSRVGRIPPLKLSLIQVSC